MRKSFSGGVHPRGYKELTRDCKIEIMPPPKDIYVPLIQHIGKAAVAVVDVGDKVKRGQLIATCGGAVGADIYSPVSGVVLGIIIKMLTGGTKSEHIHIENDFEYDTVTLERGGDILERIKRSGIVGLGGAAFPTYIKLSAENNIDTLIINGAECEPYINCDYRLMLEKTDEFIKGIRYIAEILKVKNIIIGIEKNKPEAIEKLSGLEGITIVPLKTKYPQGGEKQLIYACTKLVVPEQKLPKDIGIIVSNVHTVYSVYEAIELDKPLYERVITVSGMAIKNPKNLLVANGTQFLDILEFCGGIKEEEKCDSVISGGPMMGYSQFDLSTVTSKGVNALLFLTEKEVCRANASACINCGKCAIVCPMRLMPMFIDAYALVKDYSAAKKYGVLNCIECGCCTFICPAKRPIVQSIRVAKKLLRKKGV